VFFCFNSVDKLHRTIVVCKAQRSYTKKQQTCLWVIFGIIVGEEKKNNAKTEYWSKKNVQKKLSADRRALHGALSFDVA